MPRNGGGRGLAILALVVALIALGVSVLTYQEVGGTRALREQMRGLQTALEAARRETAEALARLERAVRPGPGPGAAGPETKR